LRAKNGLDNGVHFSLWWRFFGEKHIVRRTEEEVWPAYGAVIMVCPRCNQPCATSAKHAIACVEPLTVETPVTCPYCRAMTFKVTEGKLMPA
jgi:hypothetical protein